MTIAFVNWTDITIVVCITIAYVVFRITGGGER